MPKFVRNVTSRNYTLIGEINTPNGRDTIRVSIIPGGLYELDTHMYYVNLREAIEEGCIVPLYEESETHVKEVPEDIVPDNAIEEAEIPEVDVGEPTEEKPTEEEKVTEPDTADETPKSGMLVCPHCGAEYATERGLNKHIEKVHSND